MSEEIEDHRLLNPSRNEPFSSVLERRVSRRSVMRGGLGVAATTMLAGFGLTGCSDDDGDVSTPGMSGGDSMDGDMPAAMALAFEALAGSQQNAVVVPEGYTAQVIVPWGTPINEDTGEWSQDRVITPEFQANSVGMHHDGMYHFPLSEETASENFVLALNNEYIDQNALFLTTPRGYVNEQTNENGRNDFQRIFGEARDPDNVRTEINAHGVTLVELRKGADGRWADVRDSRYNRRLTTATPVDLSGPVAGSEYVVTAYDPTGMSTRGTNNNCANGFTPWGTYLTCEENWPDVFAKYAPQDNAEFGAGATADRYVDDDRLGIPHYEREDGEIVGLSEGRYAWLTAAGSADEVDDEFARFNATATAATASEDYRNEPRTFGYIVEIDPYTNTRAIKRTAMGRFRHEGAWPGPFIEGEPVVFYSGHDGRNEYIYKFVSDALWRESDRNMAGSAYDRLAIGAKYLDAGTLYAAKFNEDGSGEWLPLEPDALIPGTSETLAGRLGLAANDRAGVIIHTCDAADLMGATPMDRPEWGTVDPASGDVYMTLTNNSQRTEAGTEPTFERNDQPVDAPRETLGVAFDTAPVNAANPRADNDHGQVIRWREPTPGATTFDWDIFVFGYLPEENEDGSFSADASLNRSGLTEQNYFSSCDGLWYDDRGDGKGILWIQTDTGTDPTDSSGPDFTNDQVLAVIPANMRSPEGDNQVIDDASQAQLKRFAIGPNDCEVTGIFATPDKTSLFINIQHPGNWPADGNANLSDATVVTGGRVRPRASTVVIQKRDGGPIAV